MLGFFACGTRSGIMKFCVIYFPHLEGALVLWSFVLYFLPVVCSCCMCVVKNKMNKLKERNILCCIFPCAEHTLLLFVIYFLPVEHAMVFCVVFSACEPRSSIFSACGVFVLYVCCKK